MTALLLIMCLAADTLHQMSPSEVDAYLSHLGGKEPAFENRVQAIARAALGTTYVNGPLGEGPNGKFDTDPLIDLKRVDCVTYVEQTMALAAETDYDSAFDRLQRIRYRDGVIDFEARNHFMIADWSPNNPWCRDVTRYLGIDTVELTRTISRRDFFTLVKAPGLGEDFADQKISLRYIPSKEAAGVEANLPSPALIIFVGARPDWLFALHCGLFLREDVCELGRPLSDSEEDGCTHGLLYHASSKAGKVVALPLREYLEENDARYLGFTAYQITPPTTKE